jgi:hypothetical protein
LSGYPSIAALSISPRIDVMCQKPPYPAWLKMTDEADN